MKSIARPTLVSNLWGLNCVRTSKSQSQIQRHAQPSISCTQRRHESSFRRQRKMLNISPASAFGGSSLPTGGTGRSRTANKQLPPGDHIIFNPPSSAANVYHTPPKFLPSTDPRKKLFEDIPKLSETDPQQPTTPSPLAFPSILQPLSATPITAIGTNFAHSWPETLALPPSVTSTAPKKYHLGPQEIEEIRRLRLANEDKWTRQKLAAKFDCSQRFVSMVVQASQERKDRLKEEEEKRLSRWKAQGVASLKTRRERAKRKAAWMAEA